EDRLHGHRHVMHETSELRRGFGVVRRMARDLAARLVGVRPAGEVVAIVERRDGALERQDLETVRGEIEVANALGAQQADDVREDGELEAGITLFRDSGTADTRAA